MGPKGEKKQICKNRPLYKKPFEQGERGGGLPPGPRTPAVPPQHSVRFPVFEKSARKPLELGGLGLSSLSRWEGHTKGFKRNSSTSTLGVYSGHNPFQNK